MYSENWGQVFFYCMHFHSYNQFGEVCFQKARDIKKESDSNGFVCCILSRMCVQCSGHWHRLQLVKQVQILADAVMLIFPQIPLGKIGIILPSQGLNNKINWDFWPWVETRREGNLQIRNCTTESNSVILCKKSLHFTVHKKK